MVRSSKYSRLITVKLLVAVSAAALVALAMMSGSANAVVYAKKISIRIVDNTPRRAMSAAFCPTGHVSIHYEFGTRADPCNVTPFTVPHIDANGGRYPEGAWPSATYAANPLGVVVRMKDGPLLYFYAKNPTLGEPFFEASVGPGDCSVKFPCRHTKYHLSEGELKTVRVGATYVRFHREGDWRDGSFLHGVSYKIMTIEICGARPENCR